MPPSTPKTVGAQGVLAIYLVDDEYLVTAFVPSDTACLASSPGRISLTLHHVSYFILDKTNRTESYDVWISLDEMVDFLLYAASLEASVATRSKISDKRVSMGVEN